MVVCFFQQETHCRCHGGIFGFHVSLSEFIGGLNKRLLSVFKGSMSWVLVIFEEESVFFFPGVNCGICCHTSPCCSNSNCCLKILTLFPLWCDLLPVICSLLTLTTGWKGSQGWEKGSRWFRGMLRIKNDRTPKPQISRFLWEFFLVFPGRGFKDCCFCYLHEKGSNLIQD